MQADAQVCDGLLVVGAGTICSMRGGCRGPSLPRVQPVEVSAPPEDAGIRSQQPVSCQRGAHNDAVGRAGVKVGQCVGAEANLPIDGNPREALPKQFSTPQPHILREVQ